MEFSEDQVSLLKMLSFEDYVSEVIEHCRLMFPVLIKSFNSDFLKESIKKRISLAQQSGNTQRGPVRLFIDMTFMFGMGFEQELLYQWLNNISQKTTVSQIEKKQGFI